MAQYQLTLDGMPAPVPNSYADYAGNVYTEVEVRKARFEKYPTFKSWVREKSSVFAWIERAFLDLAPEAEDSSISGNVLTYHLRFVGIADGRGGRTRKAVCMSNNLCPVVARMLSLRHPEHADKLSTHPCVWDVPLLQPLVQELAELAD